MDTYLQWLDAYTGQTIEELLSLEREYRVDSLVVAIEEAIHQKAERAGLGSLSVEERIVLAVEALEREVNNGGYSQFFLNDSKEHAGVIVNSLIRIACPQTAEITETALAASLLVDDEEREEQWSRCDSLYYEGGEDIADQLFEFIRANKDSIRLLP